MQIVRKIYKLSCIAISILFIVLVIGSCADNSPKPARQKQFTIGFSHSDTDSLWRKAMNNELLTEASIRPELNIVIKEWRGSNENQIEDLENLIKLPADVIIVVPNESKPLTPVIEKAFNAGIPVILIRRKINSNNYSAFIGADNELIGIETARWVKRRLNNFGTVLEITGPPNFVAANQRSKGFAEELGSKIKIIHGGDGKWRKEEAGQIVEKEIKKGNKFDLIYAQNDEMAIGAFEALSNMKHKNRIPIIGNDALPGERGGIQMILNGNLEASLIFPTGADIAIQTALDILNSRPYKKEITLETVLIDRENAPIIKMQAAQMLHQNQKINAQKEILKNQWLQIKANEIILFVLVIIMLVILTIAFLLFRSYRMIKRINRDLEEKNIAISKQKEEISLQRDQILEMTEKIKAGNEIKVQFFTNISHEFRTPLTLIISILDQLQSKIYDETSVQKKFDTLRKNTNRLLYLINQILDFRKIDANKMMLHAAEHNVVSFLHNIFLVFEDYAADKKINYAFVSDEQEILVHYDEEKLNKIIFNLISNAFKYTPEGGSVILMVSRISIANELIPSTNTKQCVEIMVKDTGIGIPEDQLDKIFDPFYQVNRKVRTHDSGTGIGLALTKNLSELHHGKLLVESREGAGSAFKVILPLGISHLSNEEKFTQRSIHIDHDKSEISYIIGNKPKSSHSFDVNEYRHDFDKPKVLLVEDNLELADSLRETLNQSYQFFHAENGRIGLMLVNKILPDIIVSDVMMPEMDGMTFCGIVKNELRTSHIPIIILTAKSLEENVLEGYEFGADDYIIKPFSTKYLESRIKNLIDSRNKLKELYSQNTSFYNSDEKINPLDKSFLEKVIQVIEKNYLNSELGVEKLSDELGLTRVHTYRKIKALTGYSASEFIRLIKLNKSIDLMKNSELSIAEIAYRVGFETPSYFAKCFKERFNVTPTKYRSQTSN